MPLIDSKLTAFLMLANALGNVPGAQAGETSLETYANQIGITVVRAAQPGDDRRRAIVVGAPSALDAFVKQVGFDITATPPEVRTQWVNSSRAASLPHEMLCPAHSGGGEVRAENASTTIDHAHVRAHSPTGAKME